MYVRVMVSDAELRAAAAATAVAAAEAEADQKLDVTNDEIQAASASQPAAEVTNDLAVEISMPETKCSYILYGTNSPNHARIENVLSHCTLQSWLFIFRDVARCRFGASILNAIDISSLYK